MRPVWVLGQSGALSLLVFLVGHARDKYLLIRGGWRSGATYTGCRGPLLQNVVGRRDSRWGHRPICVYTHDFEWRGCMAWREPMGPGFNIRRSSYRVPLDLGPNP